METQFITIYCDEPSHTPEPVGLFLQGRSNDPAQAGQHQIELGRRGAYIVSMMKRFNNSRYWMPHMQTVRGLSRRRGGQQKVPTNDSAWRLRYRLKCDECSLTRVAIEPQFSDKLTALAEHGITAVSLRALIDAS